MTELDCRGLTCPEPVIRCKKLLASNPQDITVLVDNPASNENVSRLLARHGYAVGSKNVDGVWTIKASSCGTGCVMPEPETSGGKTLVVLATDCLGHGSDELGSKLMENFVATLLEMPDLWQVIMLNGGVKLAATPGRNLESLKALEAAGVSILVCGTCLQFFNLLEAKAVGETTNMLDVVTSMAVATKIIRP